MRRTWEKTASPNNLATHTGDEGHFLKDASTVIAECYKEDWILTSLKGGNRNALMV